MPRLLESTHRNFLWFPHELLFRIPAIPFSESDETCASGAQVVTRASSLCRTHLPWFRIESLAPAATPLSSRSSSGRREIREFCEPVKLFFQRINFAVSGLAVRRSTWRYIEVPQVRRQGASAPRGRRVVPETRHPVNQLSTLIRICLWNHELFAPI